MWHNTMIKFLDLEKVNNRFRDEIDSRIKNILDKGWYLQGEENEKFAQNFAAQIPVIKNFDYGHVPNRYVLPLGQKVQIDALSCLLEYL